MGLISFFKNAFSSDDYDKYANKEAIPDLDKEDVHLQENGQVNSSSFDNKNNLSTDNYIAGIANNNSNIVKSGYSYYSTVKYSIINEIGARTGQEDFGRVFVYKNCFIAFVADGIGGVEGGKYVSGFLADYIPQWFQKFNEHKDELFIDSNILQNMICDVNEKVKEMLVEKNIRSGSTLVLVAVQNSQLYWISVGDSRVYMYRNNNLCLLTEDHSYKNILLKNAADEQCTFEEALNDPAKNSLTNFIGIEQIKQVDKNIHPMPLYKNDKIILCSDGVYNTVNESLLKKSLSNNTDDAAALIVNYVKEENSPCQDNYTAIVINV